MADRAAELHAILVTVRARWTRRAVLRSWALGATTAAAILAVGLLAIWLLAQQGLPLVIVVAIAGLVAGVSLSFALMPLRRQPSDRQVARFIEEQAGDLDEVIVTAVDKSASSSGPVVDLIVGAAIRAAQRVDLTALVSPDTMQRATIGAAAATVAFLVAFACFAPSASRAVNVVGSYLFPAHYAIDVRPGSIKVREGQPVTITARIQGIDGGLVPAITVGSGEAARSAPMSGGTAADEFTITLNNITRSFPYQVSAGSVHSSSFNVEVIRPVRVSRIDVTYDYAAGLGLPSHTEQDGGDIFAPAGTKVRLTITADKAVSSGTLTLNDGQTVALNGHDEVMNGDLTISKDGSYRVALKDVDGLANDGTEYFIRMLDDRPPEVRILRPAGDKQVSPLEEVVIEARADDDYGVKSLELVVKSAAAKERVVPIGAGAQGAPLLTGSHTVFLEDLNVKPGDVLTYYARATDVGRGRRPTESRSDIFFLEVKPYEEEFVASASQGAGGMQEQQTGLEELIAQQKDIMAATWKLDARARRGGAAAKSASDIKAVAQAQTRLQGKTSEVAADIGAQLQAQRRRLGLNQGRSLTRPGDEPLPNAVDAMGRAAGELEQLRVSQALPHEENALAQLLKAAAEIRRRQVAMQQANGGGGNGNRQQPDLSTLFDQELRKRQATNYEQQSTTEDSAQPQGADDPLAAIRELARRQEALSKQQRDLANNKDQMSAEDIKRQLERLSRDQEELRKEAERLAQNTQSGSTRQSQGSKGSTGSSGASDQNARQLKDAAEQMRQAAGDLRNQDPTQASARGSKASEALRNAEQQMQNASPAGRRRAMGDLQLEARQIADAQRRLGNDASQAAQGAAGDDARRRLAGEQERLAERTQRLGDAVKQLASGDATKDERQAIGDAARELDKQNLPGRMRESAQALRQSAGRGSGIRDQASGGKEKADAIARALDQAADKLASARGARDAEATKLSDQLGQAQELRDRLDKLTRAMEEMQANGRTGERANGRTGQQAGERTGQQVDEQRQAIEQQLKEAQQLAEQLTRANPGSPLGGTTPEQWQRSFSAPGTEAFKQDFSKWESLKKNLQMAIEQTESRLSDQLRARENRERLNAGRHDAVSDTYRELVDRYYQSLAQPRRPNQ